MVTTEDRRRRVEFLFKMAGIKEAKGDHVAAGHFLEQAAEQEAAIGST